VPATTSGVDEVATGVLPFAGVIGCLAGALIYRSRPWRKGR
jgi:hypothetical protein